MHAQLLMIKTLLNEFLYFLFLLLLKTDYVVPWKTPLFRQF